MYPDTIVLSWIITARPNRDLHRAFEENGLPFSPSRVPSMYGDLEVKVLSQPDGGEG
jgi:hypothetical protein